MLTEKIMAVSDEYFIIMQFGSQAKITDFRSYDYQSTRSIRPREVPDHPLVSARKFLSELITGDRSSLLFSKTPLQFVDRLSELAAQMNQEAEEERINQKLGIRDNIYQLIEMLDNEFERP
jgi:hypothetical protein